MLRIAYRNMKFVRGDHTQSGITKFPPILMADGHDFNRSGRLGSILNRENHARSGQEQDENDQAGNYGPSQLHLIAAIHLRRLAPVIVSAPAKFHRGIGDQ